MHDTLLASVLRWGSPTGVTQQDSNVQRLWNVTYYIAIPLGAIVIGLIVWCAVRYRVRPDEDHIPRQVQYHIPLEVFYTIVPIALVAVLFVYTYQAENKEDSVSPIGRVATDPNINSTSLPILTLPAGETVQINLYSDDVNHSFYVPAFLFKRDAIQGINNSFDFNIDPSVAGQRFVGECTQFCGTYHPYMRFWLQVMARNSFSTWLSQHHGLNTTVSEG